MLLAALSSTQLSAAPSLPALAVLRAATPAASPAEVHAPASADLAVPLEAASVKRKRKRKMNKHKIRKRRKRDRHKRR